MRIGWLTLSSGKRGQKQLEGADCSSDGASVREAALQAAISQIEETYGKETVMWMGRNSGRKDVAVISTGSLTLDVALGIGGVPRVSTSASLSTSCMTHSLDFAGTSDAQT